MSSLAAIPSELKAQRRWVVARPEVVGGRPTKVPYCAHEPNRKASSTDPSTWSDFDTARVLVESGEFPWIGFEFEGSGYCGIDLDHCIVDGQLADWAVDLIVRLDSYTEISQSGTGVHVLLKAKLPSGGRRTGKTAKHPPVPLGAEVEMYDSGRYFVLTGNVCPFVLTGSLCSPVKTTVEERSEQVAAVHSLLFAGEPQADTPDRVATLSVAEMPDDELLAKIRASKRAEKFDKLWAGDTSAYDGDDSAADQALCNILAFWTQRDRDRIDRLFRQSKLYRPKWDREDYRDKTLTKACKVREVYQPRSMTVDDFVAYMPTHAYYCIPTREFWSDRSVNQRVPSPRGDGIPTTEWLDFNRHVEQMTWWPGHPLVIENAILADGGLIARTGFKIFNQYRPPVSQLDGDPRQVGLWLEHLQRIYPQDWQWICGWLAHRIQRPHEKCNHALVLGGEPGIGKDTLLDPVRVGVGEWNTQEISPSDIMGRFNGYLKSVLLRISEARDLGEVNRYSFYEHTKTLIAAPPEVLRIDEKHLREYYVPNLIGVVITTNHKIDGIYLPENDRRHYVAWSDATMADFDSAYWNTLYAWYAQGGRAHVVAYLSEPDRLNDFDAKAPPPRTAAWHDIVDANQSPEDAELADVLDWLKRPDVVTLDDLARAASATCDGTCGFNMWLLDRKNRRQIPHRLEACGYVVVRNPDSAQGLWVIETKRQTVYAKKELSAAGRLAAARDRHFKLQPPHCVTL